MTVASRSSLSEPAEPLARTSIGPILIVDDDPVLRTLMHDALEHLGVAVVEAEDGLTALALCERLTPEVIVSDVLMPGMNGFALCRELRSRPKTAPIPILLMTGLQENDWIATGYDAGATDFIAKPLNWTVFRHRIRYMLRTARAVTGLQEAQDRLREAKEVAEQAKEAAESADRAKTQFLANMSHELRTPLNAIIGFSSIIKDGVFGPVSTRYAEYAKIIGDSGAHLLGLINDILDTALSEARALKLADTAVDLPEAIGFSLSVVEGLAGQAEVSCTSELAHDLPLLHADDRKVKQILVNLLSNAIKFTPPNGSVALRARQDGSEIVIEVADTGIGIPPDKIELALTPFGQLDSGLTRKNDGAGLGLPLAKRLVELHGGVMDIESRPGAGTTVRVRFPAIRAIPRNALPAAE